MATSQQDAIDWLSHNSHTICHHGCQIMSLWNRQTDTMDDLPYVFDVFISYSHTNQAWVRDWLLPRLEETGLHVCIDFRSFDIGAPLLINMERAVARSRKTLLVLTPDWVN